MTFGNGIRKILKERGLNQNQFAEMLGKSPQNLSKLLKMDRPTMKTVEQMAKALDLEPFELIQGITDKSGIFRFYVETGGEQEDIESPYERLLSYAEHRGIEVTQLSEATGIPLQQLHRNSTKKLIMPEGIVWGIRKLYPDLNITWLLQGAGRMLQTIQGDDDLSAVKKHQVTADDLGRAVTKISEWVGVDKNNIAQFVDGRKVLSPDAIANDEANAARSMKLMHTDEMSAMETLVVHKANELTDIKQKAIEELSKEEIIDRSMQAFKELYTLARKERDRVKFFGDFEYIKEDDTSRFFSLGNGRLFLLTIFVGRREASQYFDKYHNNRYLIDYFPRHAATIGSLHFGEYRSFEALEGSIGGICLQHITPGYVVTGKKIKSKREMEFIDSSECVLVFKDRITFTHIVEWDTTKGTGVYDDPEKGHTEVNANELLEIYTVEIVTQAVGR